MDRLRARTSLLVGRTWDTIGGIDDQAQTVFARQAARLVAGAQIAAARQTDAYIAAYLAMALRRPARTVGVDPTAITGGAVRNGVDPLAVYSRPSVSARSVLSKGGTVTAALAAGRLRALDLANTDVQLANRQAARDSMTADDRVTGFERALDAGACELCANADDGTIYSTDELLPIHVGCGCDVAPVVNDHRVAPGLNQERRAEMVPTQKVETLDGTLTVFDPEGDPRPLEVAIREHGELGPILTDRADHFSRSPN